MMKLVMGLTTGFLVFASLIGQAHAQSECETLRTERRRLERQAVRLVADYPGTSLIMGLCAGVGMPTYNENHDAGAATIAFGLCAAAGCAFAGFNNCGSVTVEVFQLGLKSNVIGEQINKVCKLPLRRDKATERNHNLRLQFARNWLKLPPGGRMKPCT